MYIMQKTLGVKKSKNREKLNKSPIQIHVIGISIVCLCAVPCCGRLNAVLQLCLCVATFDLEPRLLFVRWNLLNCSIFFSSRTFYSYYYNARCADRHT